MTIKEEKCITNMIYTCNLTILPKLEHLIEFILRSAKALELSYFTYISKVYDGLYSSSCQLGYSSRIAIRDTITEIIDQQSSQIPLSDYMKDVISLQDFCGRYKKNVVDVLSAKSTERPSPKKSGMIKYHLSTSASAEVQAALSNLIMQLISSTNQLIISLYKFPYVILNYRSIYNTISDIPDIIEAPADIENSIIALCVLLMKFTRSSDISWVTARGYTSSTVIMDEIVDEIYHKMTD